MQDVVNAAVVSLPGVDNIWVRLLGVDEHRFRTVKFFRNPESPGGGSSAWTRVEPWMTTLVNLRLGR